MVLDKTVKIKLALVHRSNYLQLVETNQSYVAFHNTHVTVHLQDNICQPTKHVL